MRSTRSGARRRPANVSISYQLSRAYLPLCALCSSPLVDIVARDRPERKWRRLKRNRFSIILNIILFQVYSQSMAIGCACRYMFLHSGDCKHRLCCHHHQSAGWFLWRIKEETEQHRATMHTASWSFQPEREHFAAAIDESQFESYACMAHSCPVGDGLSSHAVAMYTWRRFWTRGSGTLRWRTWHNARSAAQQRHQSRQIPRWWLQLQQGVIVSACWLVCRWNGHWQVDCHTSTGAWTAKFAEEWEIVIGESFFFLKLQTNTIELMPWLKKKTTNTWSYM